MRKPIQVLVYPVKRSVNGEWEYLLLRRIPKRGGWWQGVTGGVEGEESIIDAAKRELVEETGLITTNFQDIHYSYSFPVDDRFRYLYAPGIESITEYVYMTVITDQQCPKLSDEHDEYRWYKFEEALHLLRWPGNIEALKRCNVLLTSTGGE